jgi:hypothetical protein
MVLRGEQRRYVLAGRLFATTVRHRAARCGRCRARSRWTSMRKSACAIRQRAESSPRLRRSGGHGSPRTRGAWRRGIGLRIPVRRAPRAASSRLPLGSAASACRRTAHCGNEPIPRGWVGRNLHLLLPDRGEHRPRVVWLATAWQQTGHAEDRQQPSSRRSNLRVGSYPRSVSARRTRGGFSPLLPGVSSDASARLGVEPATR